MGGFRVDRAVDVVGGRVPRALPCGCSRIPRCPERAPPRRDSDADRSVLVQDCRRPGASNVAHALPVSATACSRLRGVMDAGIAGVRSDVEDDSTREVPPHCTASPCVQTRRGAVPSLRAQRGNCAGQPAPRCPRSQWCTHLPRRRPIHDPTERRTGWGLGGCRAVVSFVNACRVVVWPKTCSGRFGRWGVDRLSCEGINPAGVVMATGRAGVAVSPVREAHRVTCWRASKASMASATDGKTASGPRASRRP